MTSIGLTTGPFDAAAFGAPTLAFSREEYLGRIAKLRAAMLDEGIDLFHYGRSFFFSNITLLNNNVQLSFEMLEVPKLPWQLIDDSSEF